MVYALDHAELTLDEGEICVILGLSGSGESTLLNMLGGLDTLDEPTSNLNSLNEGVILKALQEICRDKTVILVSHRKSDYAVFHVVCLLFFAGSSTGSTSCEQYLCGSISFPT